MKTLREAVVRGEVCGVGARRFLAGGLLIGVLAVACTRPNPAYLGPAPKDGGADGTGGTGGAGGTPYTGPAVRCVGVREECAAETVNAGQIVCDHTETSPFNAFVCPATEGLSPVAVCQEAFCTGHTGCTVDANQTAFTPINGPGGSPAPICGSTDPLQTFQVVCQVMVRRCNGFNGSACINLANVTEQPPPFCWNPNEETAVQRCSDIFMNSFEDIKVTSITVQAAELGTGCVVAAPPGAQSYSMAGAAGNLTYTGASAPVPLSIARGRSIVSHTPPPGVPGAVGQLLLWESELNPFTAAGNTVDAALIKLNRAVPLYPSASEFDSRLHPLPGSMVLDMAALVGGSPVATSFRPTGSVLVTADATQFGIDTQIDVRLLNPAGFTIGLGVAGSGTPTPPGGSCANFAPRDRLLSFEDTSQWTSPATLSRVESPITHGCAALGIQGQGYFAIDGAPFDTSTLGNVGSRLWVDLFIPGGQPNPYWIGALQAFLTCPSRNVFNAYIGQQELTGRPQQAYTSFPFVLPAPIRSTLTSPAPDCHFTFTLNVNQTNQSWLLDNVRLVP